VQNQLKVTGGQARRIRGALLLHGSTKVERKGKCGKKEEKYTHR